MGSVRTAGTAGTPARRRLRRAAPVLAAAAALLPLAVAGRAAAMEQVHCIRGGQGEPTMTMMADPITRDPMHVHDFFGAAAIATLADPDHASYADIAGSATDCDVTDDSALYWTKPLVYTATGAAVPYRRMEAYYRSWDHKVEDPTGATQVIPDDARMISGNPMATTADTRHVYWSCGAGSSKSPAKGFHAATPAAADCADATGTVYLTLTVNFPSCWDGRLNDHSASAGDTADYSADSSATVTDHFAFTRTVKGHKACPAGYPVKVVEETNNYSWNYRGDGTDVGYAGGESAVTAHGDFWNTWPHDAMATFLATCIDTDVPEASLHKGADAAVCGPPLHG